MGAAFGLARREMRLRWRALAALGILVGLVGAAVLGALAGARRTATAYERLEQATHIDDARLLVFSPGLAEQFAALPSVDRSWVSHFSVGRPEAPTEQYLGIASGPPRPPGLFTPIVVEGRMFRDDRVEEVVVTEVFSELASVEVGEDFPIRLLTKEEVASFDTGFGEPDGPRISFRVVGKIRLPGAEESFAVFVGSPAFARLVEPRYSAARVVWARLDGGLAGLGRFRAEAEALAKGITTSPGAEEFAAYEEVLPRASRSAVVAASTVLVSGLLALAGVVLLVGGFIVAQAVARYSATSGEEQIIERALGMTRGERVVARSVPALLTATIGLVVAVAGAVAASIFTPVGSIASYEPEPGIEANIALLGLGGLAVIVLVVAVFALTAYRAIRVHADEADRSVSRLAERLSTLGASAPVIVGLRFAFERGRGRTSVPVRSAYVGATLGIAGLIAVTSFAASLDRLTSTPARYGWQGDLQIIDLKPEQHDALLADPRVAAFTTVSSAGGHSKNGRQIPLSGFNAERGSLGWTMLDGRMPATRDETALGPRLARTLGLSVGDVLELESPASGSPIRKAVVGIGLGPIGSSGTFADQAAMTKEGFDTAASTQPFVEGYIRLADGVDLTAFTEEMGRDAEIQVRELPAEVRNLADLGRLPDALAGLLAVIGVAALGNALFVGVRRRRRDIAILRGLGFVGAQVSHAVRTSAVAMVLTSLAIGVPIGLVIGRVVWGAVAETAYVAGDVAWAAEVLASIGPTALVIALGAAAWPAVRASRLRPAEILRTE